uniref:Uncharacterized protein n=1 Tax=Daphnia galeata TaxID=27404 RepID=A0A8J2WL62_9CRUS|nr:unnamed protein product [Daphnia galeata]
MYLSQRIPDGSFHGDCAVYRPDIDPLCQEHQVASANKLKPNQSQKPLKNSQTLPSDFTDQGSNSSTNQQSHSFKAESSNSSSNNNLGSTRSNGQTGGAISSSNGNGLSGGDNGSGEDPNRDRKKKSDPVDKKDDVDEEDAIFTVTLNQLKMKIIHLKCWQRSRRVPEEEDDEKRMVIDDTNVEDSGRRSTESSSYLADGDSADSIEKLSNEEDIVKTEKEDVLDEIQLPPVVPTAPTVHKFQHGGQIAPLMINDLMKAKLISSITSALKETLTSALLAQTQQDSLATMDQDEDLLQLMLKLKIQ